jgi:hypothetical protein
MNAWNLVGLCILCLAVGFILGAIWCAMRTTGSWEDDE